MAEVSVTKQPRERTSISAETSPWSWDMPIMRGSLFNLNPFALMRQFTEEMDRSLRQGQVGGDGGAMWAPAVEVKEQEGKLLVCAELPGLKKEDVKVSVAEGMLTLEGERKQEREEKREGYYRSERSYGRFCRTIALPEGAKAEQASAQFNNGLLEITVPVAEIKPKRQEIPVQEAKTKAA